MKNLNINAEKTLDIKSISLSQNKRVLLDDVSFNISSGSIHLLLGSNGVGKTTLINCIIGAIEFDGIIEIDGYRHSSKSAKKKFSIIPDKFDFPNSMNVRTFLIYMEVLNGIKKKKAAKIVDNKLKINKLEFLSKSTSKSLSLGEMKKINFLQGLQETKKLIIMDEPLNSLDIESKKELIDKIKQLNKSGVSFLISTHATDFFEKIVDELTILKNKKIVFSGKYNGNISKKYIKEVGSNV